MPVIRGTNSDDHLNGTPDRDYIDGQGGNDWLSGGAGADDVQGNKGNDVLSGGDGDDFLYGDEGNDNLFGNQGNDNFIFTSGGGKDTVRDFTMGDKLHVADGINNTNIHTVANVVDHVHAVGPDTTVVDLGKGNSITLSNVNANDVQHHPENYFSISHITDLLI